MDALALLFVFLIFVAVFVFVVRIPIIIATSRGVSGSNLSTIAVLSWCGILLGITWFVALVLSLIYEPANWVSDNNKKGDLESLEKLFELKEKGVITQAEYERERKKII